MSKYTYVTTSVVFIEMPRDAVTTHGEILMLDLKINCAECGTENSVNEALSAELRTKFFAEFQHEFKQHHL